MLSSTKIVIVNSGVYFIVSVAFISSCYSHPLIVKRFPILKKLSALFNRFAHTGGKRNSCFCSLHSLFTVSAILSVNMKGVAGPKQFCTMQKGYYCNLHPELYEICE